MESIKIDVEGAELEVITVELTKEEVTSIYKARKELVSKVAELQKELESLKTSKKYADDGNREYNEEIQQANTLLTALGIQEKTNEEESYYRKPLKVATRIALLLAQQRNS